MGRTNKHIWRVARGQRLPGTEGIRAADFFTEKTKRHNCAGLRVWYGSVQCARVKPPWLLNAHTISCRVLLLLVHGELHQAAWCWGPWCRFPAVASGSSRSAPESGHRSSFSKGSKDRLLQQTRARAEAEIIGKSGNESRRMMRPSSGAPP